MDLIQKEGAHTSKKGGHKQAHSQDQQLHIIFARGSIFLTAPYEVIAGAAIHWDGVLDAADYGLCESVGELRVEYGEVGSVFYRFEYHHVDDQDFGFYWYSPPFQHAEFPES